MHAGKLWRSLLLGLLAMLFVAPPLTAQVPTPEDVFGFVPGADYKLAGYDQLLDYYRRLDAASDRVHMVRIGESARGRPLVLLFLSSADNIAQLDRWRDTSARLARARLADDEARRLAEDGKAIVWIDAGMHANELAPGQMAPELAHRVATEESAEMKKIRDNVVLLLMPMMNPDGIDVVKAWYDRHLGTPYETTNPPWLYHAYVGHDINRDGFMNNMPETRAVSRVLYNAWYPQIVYNHHQSAPAWARIVLPPYSDPVNPRIHPGVTTGVNQVGAAMANRFMMEDMPGTVSDVGYTMFWNGGGRTTPYFHNQIGILTETAHATPSPRYYAPDSKPERIAGGMATDGTDIFNPNPWKGGTSRFRDAVDYALTASLATLDLAAARRQQLLYNIYKMGRDAIEAGERGDPFAYVIPPEQWDAGEAHNLVNILRMGGVEIHRATEPFVADNRDYPAGTYVISAAQAFRPYLMDLLEQQEYPTRYAYPGGPPVPPYDLTGWTLPMQMGVAVDRIDAPFEVATARVTRTVKPPAKPFARHPGFGWALSPRPNASAKAANRLLAAGVRVHRAEAAFATDSTEHPAGTLVVEHRDGAVDEIAALAEEEGLSFTALSSAPPVELHPLGAPRVGLYKSWVPNKDEGWTRWLLEQYEVPVDTLHDEDIRRGNLDRYTAIILPHHRSARVLRRGHAPGTMPERYVGGLGRAGADALDAYVARGGTLIAFDGASDYAIQTLGLPVENVTRGLPKTQFFIPGSLIRARVNTAHPLAYGMQAEVAASFQRSRAFAPAGPPYADAHANRPAPAASDAPPSVEVVARYAEDDLLMSGWALGAKQHIGGQAAMVKVRHGRGHVVLFGFRPQFRGQSRGTYKLIFNAIHHATLDEWPPAGAPDADPLVTDAEDD